MTTEYKDPITGQVERLYNTWRNMRQRCTNPKATRFDGYGGRGITVCAEWQEYGAFKIWAMSSGYADHLSIERRDVDAHYTPDNCYWATILIQACNKRNRVNSESRFVGVTRNRKNWTAKVKYQGVITRLGTYPTEEQAARVRDEHIKVHRLPHKLNF